MIPGSALPKSGAQFSYVADAMMGSPYRHHRNTWLEEYQGRPCACSKAAIYFSGRIAPRSPRSSGFLQNEESCAGNAASSVEILVAEWLGLAPSETRVGARFFESTDQQPLRIYRRNTSGYAKRPGAPPVCQKTTVSPGAMASFLTNDRRPAMALPV
jgi:hypothetical protein